MSDTIKVIERWYNIEGKVYRKWSFDGGETWKWEETPFEQSPVVWIDCSTPPQ